MIAKLLNKTHLHGLLLGKMLLKMFGCTVILLSLFLYSSSLLTTFLERNTSNVSLKNHSIIKGFSSVEWVPTVHWSLSIKSSTSEQTLSSLGLLLKSKTGWELVYLSKNCITQFAFHILARTRVTLKVWVPKKQSRLFQALRRFPF